MGYAFKDCLIIEDSLAGIKAARAAHMPVIGFLGGSHTRFEWYQKEIENQKIPVAYTPQELKSMITLFLLGEEGLALVHTR